MCVIYILLPDQIETETVLPCSSLQVSFVTNSLVFPKQPLDDAHSCGPMAITNGVNLGLQEVMNDSPLYPRKYSPKEKTARQKSAGEVALSETLAHHALSVALYGGESYAVWERRYLSGYSLPYGTKRK